MGKLVNEALRKKSFFHGHTIIEIKEKLNKTSENFFKKNRFEKMFRK